MWKRTDEDPSPRRATPGANRRRLGRNGIVAIALVVSLATAATSSGAAAPARRAKPARPEPPKKAWLEAKSLCILPLEKHQLPATGGQLNASLMAGWDGVFTFPDPAAVVDIAGGRYPAIDELSINLTNAVVNTKHKRGKIGDPVPSEQSLAVGRFTMLAEPMLQGKARSNFRITGTGVRFDLQRNKSGGPILMLAIAVDGSLHFDASPRDLERLLLQGAKEAAGKRAILVRSIDLDLRSVGPRTIMADLHVSTLVGLLPAGLRFTARVDVDAAMNATISNLACEGDEVLGPLIVKFIRPGLAKYNNQTKPLLAFPSGDLKLRDVQIWAGERIELDARFGR